MNKRLLIISFLLINCPLVLLSQNGWHKDNVTIIGEISDYFNNNKAKTLSFYFRDIVKRDLQNTYITEIDSLGKFSIKIPIYYSQDFYLRYQDFGAKIICSPGDSLMIAINIDNTINVVGGNRLKDNSDFYKFIDGVNKIDNTSCYDLAKNQTSEEFSHSLAYSEKVSRSFLNDFKKQNNTSILFNQIAEDYIKYGTWQALLAYPEWYSEQNNIKKDSLKLPFDYFSFLNQYNMDDTNPISTNHAEFLNQYNRYILQTPKDSMDKAYSYFNKQDVVSGAKVLKNMILGNTSGFTRNLCLTKFYLDALEGKQLKEFEALYDSIHLTDSYFKRIINDSYSDLQKFMANQVSEGTNLNSINYNILKGFFDTIATKYSGKVIYIDFWAPWCSPCMAELPYSKTLQQDYKGQDIIFLFLANRCKEDAWKSTIANKGLTGEHILLNDDQYNLLSGELGITGIPHYVLIDKKGNIVFKNAPNPSQSSQIKAEIDRLLK